jgi:Ca-activated chloride channel homolog
MNRLYLSIGISCLLIFACPKSASAPPQEPDMIRVSSRLVNVDVLVTDRRTGARVDDLRKEDFELLDDGRPAEITHFSRSQDRERPFVLVLFVEVDNSIHPILPNLESKLGPALRKLDPKDQVGVFVFDPYNLQMVQELTADRELALKALNRAAGLQSQKDKGKPYKKFEALPNALLAGLNHVQERQTGARTAFVVIGSDFDVVSGKVADEVMRRLLGAGVTVAGLLKSDAQTSAAKLIVRAMTLPSGGSARAEVTGYLSGRTGGETISVRGEDYGDALEQVIGNVAQRYGLAFVPAKARLDASFHKITVRVRPSGMQAKGSKLQVRTRRGYFAIP